MWECKAAQYIHNNILGHANLIFGHRATLKSIYVIMMHTEGFLVLKNNYPHLDVRSWKITVSTNSMSSQGGQTETWLSCLCDITSVNSHFDLCVTLMGTHPVRMRSQTCNSVNSLKWDQNIWGSCEFSLN